MLVVVVPSLSALGMEERTLTNIASYVMRKVSGWYVGGVGIMPELGEPATKKLRFLPKLTDSPDSNSSPFTLPSLSVRSKILRTHVCATGSALMYTNGNITL